jgi:pilus assembly protein CpaB
MALYGAIALAVIAAIFAFFSLRAIGGGGGGSGAAAPVDAVVAAQHINRGEVITAEMLRVAEIPEDVAIANALTTTEGVVGQVARFPIEEGQQVVASNFGETIEGGGPVGRVTPHELRSVSVEVTEEKIFGGLLAPGDYVDVVAILEVTQGDEDVTIARMLVQDVEVSTVGEEQLQPVVQLDSDGNPIASGEASGEIAAAEEDPDSQPDARSVTLLVSPQDSLLIALAEAEGSLSLMVRAPGDHTIVPIEDVQLFEGGQGSSGATSGSGD